MPVSSSTSKRDPRDEYLGWFFCKGLGRTIKGCDGQAIRHRGKDGMTRVMVDHADDCPTWHFIRTRYPRIAQSIKMNR